MTNPLEAFRDEIATEIRAIEAERYRLGDKVGVLKHVLSRVDGMLGDQAVAEPAPVPVVEAKREKRDIRGAILEAMSGGFPLGAPSIKALVVARIGDVVDSALARSLSSLVGDAKIIERDGVFSLPQPVAALADAAK